LYSEPWYNQDVYVIGGGSSLKDFNWKLLEKLNTVGCNDAYKHGSTICKVCIFGDYDWWLHHSSRLDAYGGPVVTNQERLATDTPHRVHFFERSPRHFSRESLCWAGNTGVSAINLALKLGAKTVYLLGFDMGIRKDGTNWHNEIIHHNAVLPSSYQTFLKRWSTAIKSLDAVFPNRTVINVNDDSKLQGIDSVSVNEFWKDNDE